MTAFKEQVIAIVSAIPAGRVMSYGQVAAAAGSPRAAREVGWILHGLDGNTTVPWWRVTNNAGRLTIKGNFYSTAEEQKKLLEAEGVVINDDLSFDIERYRYRI